MVGQHRTDNERSDDTGALFLWLSLAVILGLIGAYLFAHNYHPKYEPAPETPHPTQAPEKTTTTHGDYPKYADGKG